MEYILLLLGFFLLLFSGKYLVKGSVSLANYFQVSKLVIGVTVVSFGTSAPEMFVSAFANFKGHADVAIGNIIGSNIANIALVLALTALIFPIPVKKASVKIDAPFMLIVSALLYLAIFNATISLFEGISFIIILVAYLVFILIKSRRSKDTFEEDLNEKLPIWKSIVLVLLSTAGLAFGSDLLVDSATIIASKFGVSERVIGITIVAFGTSLPELATSAVAAFKKEMDISIGNIIGSNIFNILAVLGVSAILRPMQISAKFIQVDIFWMIGISVLLFLFILPFKGGKLTRVKGFMLFAVYCVYIFFLL
jgi:cation:H+ antiporter